MNYIDKKTAPHRFKVNVRDNKSGKEIWKYCTTMALARLWQLNGINDGLHSIIYQKVNGKYKTI